ncbi:unnamed protein product [Agarophyton chilense]
MASNTAAFTLSLPVAPSIHPVRNSGAGRRLRAQTPSTRRRPTLVPPSNNVKAQQQHFQSVEDLPTERIPLAIDQLPSHWATPGVYGVYASDHSLQYVAAVADVSDAIANHIRFVRDPELCFAVRMLTVDNLDQKEALGDLAEKWVRTHAQHGPGIPPGNSDRAPEWRKERKPDDIYFSEHAQTEMAEGEIQAIIRENDVVLFMKGTRKMPRCGFSAAVVDILQSMTDEFVCVDCLDEWRNTGLRGAIKEYSQWPTIPQLYVRGEFVGGHDIVRDMMGTGELQTMIETVAAERA